jgi:hypothetical protein
VVGSLIADPLFVNPDNYNFRLRPESPALKMGFQQINMSTAGPREPGRDPIWSAARHLWIFVIDLLSPSGAP